MRQKLAPLAAQGIYFGTSSWKYEGWLGQIYTPERYFVFADVFRKSVLRANAWRSMPKRSRWCAVISRSTSSRAAEFWRKLFTTAPATLRFAFKVPEEITVRAFPGHPRYGGRAGAMNPNFLDVALLKSGVSRPA